MLEQRSSKISSDKKDEMLEERRGGSFKIRKITMKKKKAKPIAPEYMNTLGCVHGRVSLCLYMCAHMACATRLARKQTRFGSRKHTSNPGKATKL